MADDREEALDTSDTLILPFIYVPHGQQLPPDWAVAHPDAVRIPASFRRHRRGDDPAAPAWRLEFDPFAGLTGGTDDGGLAHEGSASRGGRLPGEGPVAEVGIAAAPPADPVATYLRIAAALARPGSIAPGSTASVDPGTRRPDGRGDTRSDPGDMAGDGQVAERQQFAELARGNIASDVAAGPGGQPGAVARLNRAAQEAFEQYKRDCSRAVWSMLRDLGNPAEPYRTANQLMAEVARPGSGWREVSMQEASDLANKGKLVIGGLADPTGNGHVVGVMPGPMRPAGGFNGIPFSPDVFPPSLSGSIGNWPRGDQQRRPHGP